MHSLATPTGVPLTSFEIWQVAGAVFVLMVVVQAMLYILLYRRPRIDEALVRTGLWDVRVTVNTGLFVLPFVHHVKRVPLSEYSLTLSFAPPRSLVWQGGERFEGTMTITIQVPAETPNLIMQAARSIRHLDDAETIAALVEGVYRSTSRDVLRTIKRLTFDIEPAAVEVRLAQSLDVASTAFGLRVRAVHMQDKSADSERIRRAMAQVEGPNG